MFCKVLSVRTKESKSALVILDVETEEKRQKYTVSEGTYREIGCPLSGEVISEDTLFTVAQEDERRRAMAKALRLLTYADNNEKALYRKLITAGFSKSAAEYAKEECVRLGYINEERQIERLILKYYNEYMGPKKILSKLASRSYSPKQVIKLINSLEEKGEVDFKKSKNELLKMKLTEDSTYEEKMKILYKYGYTK